MCIPCFNVNVLFRILFKLKSLSLNFFIKHFYLNPIQLNGILLFVTALFDFFIF